MPNTVSTPGAGEPVDRLALAVSQPRGAEPSFTAAAVLCCNCFANEN